MITPLVFAGAVSAAAPSLPVRMPSRHAAVTPVAAVSPTLPDLTGPAVVAVDRGPTVFHVAEPALSAPPPAMIVNAPGALGIPSIALAAYRSAEQKMAVAVPGCGVSWNLLAGIGRIESGHAGGGAVDARGTAISPIYGPSLDGTLPGNETIIQSSAGNRVTYARAMGPMQFLPGTWARYASDGKGDGVADPQNIFDATLAAARYLCSGGLNLRDQTQVLTAILRYNNSMPYAQNVLGWAAAYATGVVPVDLPPMTGPPPPLGDAHLEHPEGLGPNLPMNINGLPLDDPLARIPLIDLSSPALVSPPPMFPWMTPTPQQAPAQLPGCTVQHRPAPHHRGVPLGELGDGDYPDLVRDGRQDHRLDLGGPLGGAHHPGDGMAVDIGVQHTDRQAAGRHRRRQVDRDGGLADPALAGRDGIDPGQRIRLCERDNGLAGVAAQLLA